MWLLGTCSWGGVFFPRHQQGREESRLSNSPQITKDILKCSSAGFRP